MAIHSRTSKATLQFAITNLSPFNLNGTLKGFPDSSLYSGYGNLYPANCDRFNLDRDTYGIDYVILSYTTPIAWHTPQGWHVPTQKHSPTTSNHQSAVLRAIDNNL